MPRRDRDGRGEGWDEKSQQKPQQQQQQQRHDPPSLSGPSVVSAGLILIHRPAPSAPPVALVVRRAYGNYPSRGWEIAKGKVEEGDATVPYTAVRELREETGLTNPPPAGELSKLCMQEYGIYDKEMGCRRPKKVFYYVAWQRATPVDDPKSREEETKDVAWLTESETRGQTWKNKAFQDVALEAFEWSRHPLGGARLE
eukprot:Hpha_TRINITY_DN16778_c1_g1::TRINITY_DN16778_c1_g1_i1::g.77522::m.77522